MMKTLSGEDSAGLPASLQAAEVQHRREESAVGGSSEKPPPPSLPPPLLLSGGAADEVDLQGMSMRMPGSKGKRAAVTATCLQVVSVTRDLSVGSKVAGIDNRSDLSLGKVETLTASLGLGDLAGLSLTNEAEPLFNVWWCVSANACNWRFFRRPVHPLLIPRRCGVRGFLFKGNGDGEMDTLLVLWVLTVTLMA